MKGLEYYEPPSNFDTHELSDDPDIEMNDAIRSKKEIRLYDIQDI